MHLPKISVVMPVLNEQRFIGTTIDELLDQDYPRHLVEILVCDGGSTDDTRRIVEDLARDDSRIVLLDNPKRRSSSGRNVGFRAATGDLVVVVDGHVKIGRTDYFRSLARCLDASNADCLGRPQPLIPSEGKPVSEAICLLRSSRLGHSPSSFIYSGYEGFAPAASMGAAYTPRVFRLIGYVDEDFDACEDLDFNTRIDHAGLRCYTSPDLKVSYYARTTLRALFLQMYRYGFGRYKYMRKHPRAISISQLAPPFLTLCTIATLPLFYLDRFVGGGALLLVSTYWLIVLTASMDLARRTTWSHFFRFLVIFPTVHYGLGLGWISSLLRCGQVNR